MYDVYIPQAGRIVSSAIVAIVLGTVRARVCVCSPSPAVPVNLLLSLLLVDLVQRASTNLVLRAVHVFCDPGTEDHMLLEASPRSTHPHLSPFPVYLGFGNFQEVPFAVEMK